VHGANDHGYDSSVGEIEVTERMVKAGLEALQEHKYGEDLSYVLESVFRAMSYGRCSASSTSASRYE